MHSELQVEEKTTAKLEGTNLHSMILIGARKTISGEYYFLLQNWWEVKYFIEVSSKYLFQCGATITFVNTPINSTRKVELEPLLCNASYAETGAAACEMIYER
eukprot:gene8127-16682_t